MVRKITALLIIVSVAALCAAPSFADDIYTTTLSNYWFYTNRNPSEGNVSGATYAYSNDFTFSALNYYSQIYCFRLFSDSSHNSNLFIQKNFTYHLTATLRFSHSDTMNGKIVTWGNMKQIQVICANSSSMGGYLASSLNSSAFTVGLGNSSGNMLYSIDYDDISYTVTYNTNSPYTIDFDIVFNTSSFPFEDDVCNWLNIQHNFRTLDSFSDSTNTFNLMSLSATYDPLGDEYDNIVLGQLQDLQEDINNGFSQNHQDLQNIKNNLDSIDTSVQGVGDKVDDMSDDIQQKMEDLQQQERDDVEDSYDDSAVDDLEEQIDLSFTDSISQLYSALSYSGTSFNFQLPASGNIPFLNSQLWSAQNIPLKEYIDKLPSVILVGIRLLLGLGFGLVIVAEIRSIIHMINGSKGD